MKNGKKQQAVNIMNKVIKKLIKNLGEEVVLEEYFEKLMENIMTRYSFTKRRMGSKIIAIPHLIEEKNAKRKRLKNLYKISLSRKENNIVDCLYNEIIAAHKNEGATIKERDRINKLANENRAYVFLGKKKT